VVFKHILDTQEILVRVLLAGGPHVREKKPISLIIVRIQRGIVLHGSVDPGDSALSASILCWPELLMFGRRNPYRAENASVPRSWTSVCFVEEAKEFRDVQQVLQYGVAVTQQTGIAQTLGFGFCTPEVVPQRSSESCKGPAFANSPVFHGSHILRVWLRGRHDCMRDAPFLGFLAGDSRAKTSFVVGSQ
jgi:hypothetical protein